MTAAPSHKVLDSASMKLWLIRHAKSDWHSGAATDFERPLNARGRRDGPRMAAWLGRQEHPATWIWTSNARRAAATARFVAEGFAAAEARVVDDRRLYNADPGQLLDVLRETPAEVECAAVVAHNPGMTQLVNLLSGTAATDNLPTFGVARLDVPAPWVELGYGVGTLELLTSPKRLDQGD